MTFVVRQWLRSRLRDLAGIRTPPPTVENWDAQYSSGRWIPVGQISELSRLSLLVGYLRFFSRGGAVLDIGCGEGVLVQKLPCEDYSRYVGIDFSRAAVDRASQLGIAKATFTAADAETYVPDGTFDAIVFTECLYYFSNPRSIVERYVGSLNKSGIVVVSMNTNFRGVATILRMLKHDYPTLDEVQIVHPNPERSWTCVALAVK